MDPQKDEAAHLRWAHFKFGVIAQLLAAPPPKTKLREAIAALAARVWRHPLDGEPCRFGFSTIERWYYEARAANDPIQALKRNVRRDRGRRRALTGDHEQKLLAQYWRHRRWTYKLHHANLAALLRREEHSAPCPSYATVRRFMKSEGLRPLRRRRARNSEAALKADDRLARREVRSFEMTHTNALWHLDYHVCSRQVLLRSGAWVTPRLLAVLDDRSRLTCHAQWYVHETAENLVHGLSQALLKRGLCCALMEDNGSAMRAAELKQGLKRLGVDVEHTLDYAPYQNGKCEIFWKRVEGRLLPMLEGVEELSLEQLNEATVAWVELDYNRELHTEIGESPLERFLRGPSVGRPAPTAEALRLAFGQQVTRTQRRSDGTITVEGVRFEVPSRLRNLDRLTVRYARWDLSRVYIIDPRTDQIMATILPLDRARNADGRRRPLDQQPSPPAPPASPLEPEVAPLLREIVERYRGFGLPPAYLHQDEEPLAEPPPVNDPEAAHHDRTTDEEDA